MTNRWLLSGALLVALTAGGRAARADATALELVGQAEARMRAGQWADAAALWERVTAFNPVVASYWDRLARARAKVKDYRGAVPAYEKALALGAGFPWETAYEIARCYALLGDKDQAFRWLGKAFALGFRSLEQARGDEDFKALRPDPRFRELVALVDLGQLSRTDGYRYDLKLLIRELKRLHYDLSKRPAPAGFDDLARQLHDDIPKLSDRQVEVGFMKLMRLAGDGHTEIAPLYYYKLERKQSLPVQFYLFDDGLFITSASPRHKDLAGARVLRLGGHSEAKVREELDCIISRDNSMWPRYVAPSMMRQPQLLNGLGLIAEDDRATLTVRDARGRERTVTLRADSGNPAGDWTDARAATPGRDPLYLKDRKTAYWFEHLPDSRTVYFQYNQVRDDAKEPFDKFCARLFEFIDKNLVDRLVLDLRWNTGGNNELFPPLVHGLVRCAKINQRGKLFVVVGRQTFSAAQCGATWIERHTNALFVGEPTGSRPNFVGETVVLNLPYSKMRASISDLFWQNSSAEDFRTWIAPHLYAPPTFKAYVSKRDPALEAILAP